MVSSSWAHAVDYDPTEFRAEGKSLRSASCGRRWSGWTGGWVIITDITVIKPAPRRFLQFFISFTTISARVCTSGRRRTWHSSTAAGRADEGQVVFSSVRADNGKSALSERNEVYIQETRRCNGNLRRERGEGGSKHGLVSPLESG